MRRPISNMNFPLGLKRWKESILDLSSHQEYSGKKLQYFDPETNKNYVPFVVETSIGVDRMFLQIISAAYTEETLTKEDGSTDSRVVLKLPPALAPVKLAVFPLTKKDGLPQKARTIMNQMKFDFNCQYEEKDSIGKRYRRQDAIGTPFCITIDHQTLEDDTVTIRYRDTMEQDRIHWSKLQEIIQEKVSMRNLFETITD
jgi:glycyl-tRNA synthetase